MSGGDEFAVIARCFAPLARDPAARGLIDDAALLQAPGPFVVTADAIVEGVHFLPDDPIDTVAQKALRVNISDIAAKGAAPAFYLVTLQWPKARPADAVALFAEGLARDQRAFGCSLIGGDTTSTPGPLAISITMLGRPLAGSTPSRSGARVGDDVWVTGTIGDGVLGLKALTEGLDLDGAHVDEVIARYRVPTPRVTMAATIAAFATASMDVSDGLLGDAAKIAAASGVRLVIEPGRAPLSAAGAAWLAKQPHSVAGRTVLLNGGDDYEILFTAAPERRPRIKEAADDAGVQVSRIGQVCEGQGVDAGGVAVEGHVHRLGA